MILDARVASAEVLYKLLAAVIVPRPIALVSTISPDGIPNLAPFSSFMPVATEPPVLAFAPTIDSGRPADTLANIRATGEPARSQPAQRPAPKASRGESFANRHTTQMKTTAREGSAARKPEPAAESEGRGARVVELDRVRGVPVDVQDHVVIVGEELRDDGVLGQDD